MKAEHVVLLAGLILVNGCQGMAINSETSPPLVDKMDEITRHLQDLTKSMSELDRQLEEAVLINGVKEGASDRYSSPDDNDVNCRLHLHEDICQVWEILQEHSGFLRSPTSPGKRSADLPAPNYRKLAADLKRKREVLHSIGDVFKNAGFLLEREKKWMTCNLNLGFTCQTQEYSNIADYYDFLNSADSPGKKRSVPDQVPSKS